MALSDYRAALDLLALIPGRRAALDAETAELVVAAQAAGASFGDIGRALGTTRQAARERYGS